MLLPREHHAVIPETPGPSDGNMWQGPLGFLAWGAAPRIPGGPVLPGAAREFPEHACGPQAQLTWTGVGAGNSQ